MKGSKILYRDNQFLNYLNVLIFTKQQFIMGQIIFTLNSLTSLKSKLSSFIILYIEDIHPSTISELLILDNFK